MLMLDLFSGLGGASKAMRERGWEVVTVDNDPRFNCTHTADLNTWSWDGERPDLVWASPPCQEFSRWGMPWLRAKNPPVPSMNLVLASLRIIMECDPKCWVIENVGGAVGWFRPVLGKAKIRVGSAHLWGKFPPLGRVKVRPHKEQLSGRDVEKRSAIPIEISRAFAITCESMLV